MITVEQVNAMLNAMEQAPYNSKAKAEFKIAAMRFLRIVRQRLGIEADVRFNAGGIAIPGDAILHGDTLYITFGGSGILDWIMFRTCEGRTDFTGGASQRYGYSSLRRDGVDGFVEVLIRAGFGKR